MYRAGRNCLYYLKKIGIIILGNEKYVILQKSCCKISEYEDNSYDTDD